MPTYFSDILVSITKAQEKMLNNVYNVRFKQTSKHVAQHLKSQQGPCQQQNKKKVDTYFSHNDSHLAQTKV
jgi:hypothetical protein